MFKHPSLFIGALALSCSASLAAQSQDVHELPAINVSASRVVSISESLPVGLVVIDRDTVARSTSTNLVDLLSTVAGVSVRRMFGMGHRDAQVDMLGFGATSSDNTLLLLNGRRLNNPDMSVVSLATIPLSAVERIEVMPGSGSVLYGYGAAGGVINIVTRSSYDSAAGITLTAGDYDTTGVDLWGAYQHDNVGLLASLNKGSTDGFRQNGSSRYRSAFLDGRINADEHTFFYLTVRGDKEDVGLPGPLSAAQMASNPEAANTPDDNAEYENYQIMPGLEVSLYEQVTFHLDTGYRKNRQAFDYVSWATNGRGTIEGKSVSPRFSGLLATGALTHQWTLGYDWQKNSVTSDWGGGANTTDRNEKSWYLHDVMSVTETVALTMGARQAEVRTETAWARDTAKVEMYQGGIQFKPVPQFALFFNAERSARLPNFDEGILLPQVGKMYSLGGSWQQGRQFSTLTLWNGTFKNEIIYDPNAGMWGANINLAERTEREGISLNSRWQLDDKTSVSLGGAYQLARFDEGPNKGDLVPSVPRAMAHGQFDWQVLDNLSLALSHRFVGRRKLDADWAGTGPRLKPYHWTDLVATFSLAKAKLTLGVYNLQDKVVADYGAFNGGVDSYYPLPDRHLLATLGYQW